MLNAASNIGVLLGLRSISKPSDRLSQPPNRQSFIKSPFKLPLLPPLIPLIVPLSPPLTYSNAPVARRSRREADKAELTGSRNTEPTLSPLR
jgi:hypothetical protein